MDGDRVVEVLLGGTHGDSDGNTLHHLVNSFADADSANDLLVGGVLAIARARLQADHFNHTLLLVLLLLHGREEHVDKVGFVNSDVLFTVLLLGSLLGETDSADHGVGEDNSGDVRVAHLQAGAATENSLGQNTASSYCDGSQRSLVSHVTDGVDARGSRVLELVNLDGALDKLN